MTREALRRLLEALRAGETSVDEALERLAALPFEDLGFAKVDHHRALRKGLPEVIYGAGKTPDQVAGIFERLAERSATVLCTRASEAAAEAVRQRFPEARYDRLARMILLEREKPRPVGLVAVAAAGTSDLPVAEEAALTLEAFGSRVERLYDVGVAGLHRLLAHGEVLRTARCVVAVAGMEGALPSVIGGLVAVPVIAVPTSVGYGASFGGIAALLAMLNSCASGVSVVNIDNGFGAGYQAHLINRLAGEGGKDGGEGKG
ncbi:MAG: nickel pincer cofactor biosynthesis protein LarB [Candidatus Dadabacteria bacterium]|nr:MAG: nickel pincer cofactor biosynthesis protein LarB [Candidatus Dadabacteria bacterium]